MSIEDRLLEIVNECLQETPFVAVKKGEEYQVVDPSNGAVQIRRRSILQLLIAVMPV